VREKNKNTSSKEAKTYDTNGIEQAILDEGIGKAFAVALIIISIARTNGLEYPREVNACAAARK
jgi:hypothetical protein